MGGYAEYKNGGIFSEVIKAKFQALNHLPFIRLPISASGIWDKGNEYKAQYIGDPIQQKDLM